MPSGQPILGVGIGGMIKDANPILTLLIEYICSNFLEYDVHIVIGNITNNPSYAPTASKCSGLILWNENKFSVTNELLQSCKYNRRCVIAATVSEFFVQETVKSIYEGYMESRFIHYIFILESDIGNSLLPILREGTQVTSITGNFMIGSKNSIKQMVWTTSDAPHTDILKEPSGLWGTILPDGKVTGMIGLVRRHEVDFAIDSITNTVPRTLLVDFIYPYYQTVNNLFSRRPGIANEALTVILPFQSMAWMAIGFTVVICAASCMVIDRAAHAIHSFNSNLKKQNSLTYYLFYNFGSIVSQATNLQTSATSSRMLLTCIFFFNLIFCAYYSAGLVSIIARPKYEKPVDTLEHAVEIFKTTNVYLLMHLEGAFYEHLEKSEGNIFADLYKEFIPHVSNASQKQRYKQAENGLAIALNTEIATRIYASYRTSGNGYISRDTFWMELYSMATSRGCPYKQNFDEATIAMLSSGLLYKWIDIEMKDAERQYRRNRKQNPNTDQSVNRNRPFTMYQLQAVFYILGGVFVLSLIAFGYELVFHMQHLIKSKGDHVA